MRDRRTAYKFLVAGLRERDKLEERGMEWRVILRWIFKKQNRARSIYIWLEIWTSGRHL